MTISTRQSKQDDQLLERLQGLLEAASLGSIAFGTDALAEPGSSVDECLTQLEKTIQVLHQAGVDMATQAAALSYDNLSLYASLELANKALDRVADVGFDHELDQAADELMMAIEGHTNAHITPLHTLVFNESTPLTKSELKSILQVAISRWVTAKLT